MDEHERTIIGGGPAGPAQLQLPPTFHVTLSFTQGPLKGQKIKVAKTFTTVGRKPPADVVVPDPTVSGAHAVIEVENEIVFLKDKGSTNGTYHSGAKVKEAKISNMDEIGFGDTRAMVSIVKDSYGIYSEEDEAAGQEAWRASDVSRIQAFENCLIAGYGAAQMGVLRELVEKKKLANVTSGALNGIELLQEAGRSFAERKPVDLIITEVKMTGMNGVQASMAFRAFERGFGLKVVAPIVFFTELPKDANMEKAVEYLKPCKYLQSVPDRTEFERRAQALVGRLAEIGSKKK